MVTIHAHRVRLVSAKIPAGAILAAGLVFDLVLIAQGVFFISVNTPTYDEARHLAAGSSYLGTREFRLEPQSASLVKKLLAQPPFLFHRLPIDHDNQRPESATRFNPH